MTPTVGYSVEKHLILNQSRTPKLGETIDKLLDNFQVFKNVDALGQKLFYSGYFFKLRAVSIEESCWT